MLIDPHGRHIHKLRLGLLDACNFRCPYCMPKNPSFLKQDQLLSRSEIRTLSKYLVELGIDEIRVTGGEPTLRQDFLSIVKDLSDLPLKKLGVTSNGFDLYQYLSELKKTQCQYINISLDSLNKAGFQKMTGTNQLENVLRSIFMAQELGFKVKINCVLMKGINDHEVKDFIEFSAHQKIEVRFLELMRIGEARESFDKHFISYHEIMEKIQNQFQPARLEDPVDSTSRNFHLNNGARIGFIASESLPFCGGCSRLRLSPTGSLRPCLMKNEGKSLKNKNLEQIKSTLYEVMKLKPIERIYDVSQQMNQIGG